ncbi:MAG: DUF4249 domain-containing protein [Chitinophagaceae bacterium]
MKLRNEAPILVVEGNITTDTVLYTVKLTYSGQIAYSDDIPDQYLEKNAKVTILDNLGDSTTLVYTGTQGVYQTTDTTFIGQVGRSYSVKVELPSGKTFVSKPELIKPAVPISSLNIVYDDKFDFNFPTKLKVYADINDPADQENYYKWDFTAWTGRQTHGVPCGFGCLIYEYCYQRTISNDINIYADDAVNGNVISNQYMGQSYIYTYLNHFIEIKQSSISRDAYLFWQSFKDQTTRTGSILDPLPASIKGNIYNQADPEEFALGYFSASSVTHKKAELIPYSITDYLLKISAEELIPPGSVACFQYFPNTLSYDPPPAPQYPPPPGWDTAEQIEVHW